MRIEKSEGRIEGFCQIPGWRNESSVISFMRNNDKWHVSSSTCLPTNIAQAKTVLECYQMAFNAMMEAD